METNKKKAYDIILCLKKKGIPDEIIYILFFEWKIEKNYSVCANIYCSNYVAKKINNCSICSNICDIHYNIQYMLKNDIHQYEDDENRNSYIYESICKLTNEEKNKIYEKYPLYFNDNDYTPFYY